MKELTIDQLAAQCGYFSTESNVNNNYNCNHPDQEEIQFDNELKRNVGKCLRHTCPLAFPKHCDSDIMILVKAMTDKIVRCPSCQAFNSMTAEVNSKKMFRCAMCGTKVTLP